MRQLPHVLIVDDSPADTELVYEASAGGRFRSKFHAEMDGEKAMAYVRRVHEQHGAPLDLILLDLNLPGKHGLDVLAELKGDPRLCAIPVVVFSSSQFQRDIRRCYEAGANCYVNKPGDLEEFFSTIQSIEQFWFGCAQLLEEGTDGFTRERAVD
jgi:CheY-like chemotaxis protein